LKLTFFFVAAIELFLKHSFNAVASRASQALKVQVESSLSLSLSSPLLSYCSFRAGLSNSVSYAGHILTKKWLAGRIERKNVSAGRNRRLKVPLYCKNISFCNNLSNFFDVAGRTNTSGRPHAARGPRVWDPCFRGFKWLRPTG